MDISSLLVAAMALLTLATAGGFGLQRGRISVLREELKDEREGRASDRETIRELRSDLTEARAEIAKLSTDVDAIGRVARGEAHWVGVGEQLDTHHAKSVEHWQKDEEINAQILEVLKAWVENDK